MNELTRRRLLKGGAAAVALAALGLGGAIHVHRQSTRVRSDTISETWDRVPFGEWLLPGLRDATMVVPDRPHSHAEAMDEALKKKIQRIRRFSVNSNDHRMRGVRALAEPKASGSFRVACLGDSVTFGWGVEDHESWPALVEQRLRDRGVDAEVLNLGVPAQRIDAMCAWLENVGPELSLDGVVIAERIEMGQTPQTYAQGVMRGLRRNPATKALLALPPISRFDPNGRNVYVREHQGLRQAMGTIPVIDLTDRLWAAQTETGVDLRIEGPVHRVVRRGTGEVLLEAQHQGPDLPPEIYALFDGDPTVKEPLFFDSGHPDAEGFHPFADGVVEAMGPWFS